MGQLTTSSRRVRRTTTAAFVFRITVGSCALPALGCADVIGIRQLAVDPNTAGSKGESSGDTATPDATAGGSVPSGDASSPVATVRLVITVTGGGNITSTPAGIDCTGSTCSAEFPAGTQVKLTAEASESDGFSHWEQGCTGIDPQCDLTLDTEREVTANFAAHGSVRWVHHFDSDDGDYHLGARLAVGTDGNPVVAGTMEGAEVEYLQVVKLDKTTGETIWNTPLDYPCQSGFGGLAVDASNAVYVAFDLGVGEACSPLELPGKTIMPGDIVVVRLDPDDGTLTKGMSWGADESTHCSAIAASEAELIVAGSYSGSFELERTILTSPGYLESFVMRVATVDGSVIYARSLGAFLETADVALAGNRFTLTGSYDEGTLGGDCALPAFGFANAGFVAQFSLSSLGCEWSRGFGDGGDTYPHAIVAFGKQGWAVAGSFRNSITLVPGGSELKSAGGFDAFVGRYDTEGGVVWSSSYGGYESEDGVGVAATPAGETLMAGRFGSSVALGDHDLVGPDDAFVAALAPGATPDVTWVQAIGGSGPDATQALATDPLGRPYVLASFQNSTTVGDKTLTCNDTHDAWLAALVP